MILGVTGHRPKKLGGYDEAVFQRVVKCAHFMLELERPHHVITGMALGWDQAVATAAIQLSIPFTAACPFEDMHVEWPTHARGRFLYLHEQAQHVEYVSAGGYSPWKMQERNEWIVDRSTRIAALWDGTHEGGTWNCLTYAFAKPVPVGNYWPYWALFA